jgi:hypothetical protein
VVAILHVDNFLRLSKMVVIGVMEVSLHQLLFEPVVLMAYFYLTELKLSNCSIIMNYTGPDQSMQLYSDFIHFIVRTSLSTKPDY